MPSQEKILEMRNARYKGATYQRKEKSTPTKDYKPKVMIPPAINPLVVVESILDMGKWLNDVRVSAYAIDILQIPSQKEKLLKDLESNHNIVKETALPSNNAILEYFLVVLEDMPIVLHSVDPKREDHPAFYVSLLVDDLLLHNCMLDLGASSNILQGK